MGNSVSSDSRRHYARPGELVPPIPETKPAELRPNVAPVPNHKNPTLPAGQDKINRINRINTINAAEPIHRTKTVSMKSVSARFELLPDRKPQWNRIGVSAAAQLAVVGLLLLAPLIFPEPIQTALKFEVVELMQPISQIETPPKTPPPPKIKRKIPPPKPEPVPDPVELNPRQPHVFLITKPKLPKVRTLEARPVELNPILTVTEIVLKTSQPAAPKEEVKVALNKVQTGGFGDPNGLPIAGNLDRAANINRAGSPLLSGGPGYGNGSSGARGIRGAAAADSKPNGRAAGGASSGVDILNKPNPVYSPEGRTLRIEGDVVLEVVFLASGQMQVTRVVSSLGHGLDEAAIQAAKQIRFRPAKHDGQPVDFPARVRIGFRLSE
jgi:TonB family protein